MNDNDWRNAMIEEAAKAITQANDEYGELAGSGSAPWEVFIARVVLAVFEKALGEATVNPTGAQRSWDLGPNEDISTTIGFDQGWTVTVNRHAFGCSLVWERTGSWDDHLTDLLPSEVDELVSAISPSTPRPHRCSQGEPSDAQADAAAFAVGEGGVR